MTILAVASPKGGVGKTTVALNLAFAMATRNHRTLLLDLDPQGSIGLSLAGRPKNAEGAFEALAREDDPFRYVIQTRRRDLGIMTFGQIDMEYFPQWGVQVASEGRVARLFRRLSAEYELLIVDTPAGCGGLTRETLTAASHVVTPLQTDPLALRALPQLVDTVGVLRGQGARVQIAGVVLTMTRFRESLAASIAQEAWSLLPDELVTDTHVPHDRVFAEASAKGVPLGLLRKRPPPAAAVFDHLAMELETRLDLVTDGDDDDEPIYLVD